MNTYAFEVLPENVQKFSKECSMLLESWANRKLVSVTPIANGNFIMVVESESGPTTSVISALEKLAVSV